MADFAPLRVSGPVLNVKERSFQSKAGKQINLHVLTILLATGTTDVSVFDDNDFLKGEIPAVGDLVDFAVNVKANPPYGLNVTASDVWTSIKLA